MNDHDPVPGQEAVDDRSVASGADGPTAIAPVNGAVPGVPDQTNDLRALHPHNPHPRDARGDAIIRRHAVHTPPLPTDVPLEKTPLGAALQILRQFDPVTAHRLEHDWEHQVRESLRTARRVIQEEEDRLASYNAHARKENEKLDNGEKTLEEEGKKEIEKLRQQHDALDEPLADAHMDACQKVSEAGSRYTPEDPSPDCLYPKPRSLEAIAASLRLPWPPQEHLSRLQLVLSWFATGAAGTLIGTSGGLLTHVLHANTLGRTPIRLLVCWVCGIGIACITRLALSWLSAKTAERYYLGHRASNWAPWLVATIAVWLASRSCSCRVCRARVRRG